MSRSTSAGRHGELVIASTSTPGGSGRCCLGKGDTEMFRRIKLVAAALMALSATFIGSGAGIAATATPDYQAIDAYVSRSLAGAPGVALAIMFEHIHPHLIPQDVGLRTRTDW